jgi:hypothetical protein
MAHNLDLASYSLSELFGLFDMTYETMNLANMKRAKNQVMMLHPDKSKLPQEYFLFYKQAFDTIHHYYAEHNRQNQRVPTENPEYNPEKPSSKIRSIDEDVDFQRKFNDLFEKNMVSAPDPRRNDWFKDEKPIYDDQIAKMGRDQAFETIKSKQSALIRHQDSVQTLMGGGTKLYDDDADDAYVSCDPFSKLKFEDLRKVHKDQTVFSVSERDFARVQTYTSTEHLARERGQQDLKPMVQRDAERMWEVQQKEHAANIARKQHEATLKTMEYEKKNRDIIGNFLRLH